MTVSKEVTRLEHSAAKLTVTIAKDDVRTEYDKLINEYSKTLQIPGFRKGKVPREVLLRKFGDAFKGEALGHIIEDAVAQVFEDESQYHGPAPVRRPRADASAPVTMATPAASPAPPR
ncbi:hypothetical protein FACS189473_4990 [Spirochaetia bacterium]|nr:hypothetical protein FACS189473_4990 [Spirochaetia bacterium]